MLIALTLAGALSTQQLLHAAERLPFGTTRSLLVAIVEPVHETASALLLDRPGRFLRSATSSDPTVEPTSEVESEPLSPLAPESVDEVVGPTLSPIPPSAPTTLAPTTTAPRPAKRPVMPARRLRLWAGGDSLGEYVGNQLLFPISDSDLTDVALDYRISTGLARPDYFDWQAQITSVMAQDEPPEALVFMVGGNDDQNMLDGSDVLDFATAAWFEEYRERVTTIMDVSDSGESHLYWIGLPPMRDERRQVAVARINQILATEADAREWVSYVDIELLFSGPDGGFTTHIADSTGRQRVARAPDGVHITFTGSTWVADRIWGDIHDRWPFPEGPLGPPEPAYLAGFDGGGQWPTATTGPTTTQP